MVQVAVYMEPERHIHRTQSRRNDRKKAPLKRGAKVKGGNSVKECGQDTSSGSPGGCKYATSDQNFDMQTAK
jgi:hypothetical protein